MLNINLADRMSFKEFFDIEIFQLPDLDTSGDDPKTEEKTIYEIHRETIGW